MPKNSKEIELVYSTPENTPVSKKGYFVSPIDKNWMQERRKEFIKIDNITGFGLVGTGIATLFGGAALFIIPWLPELVGFWGTAAVVGGYSTVGFSSFSFPFRSRTKRNKDATQHAINVTSQLIRDWLLKKYNLTISVEEADLLSAYVNEATFYHGSKSWFRDSKGDEYKLDFIDVNGKREYFVVFVAPAKNDANAYKPENDKRAISSKVGDISEAIKKSTRGKKESIFTGESATLYSSIIERLGSLEVMELDADDRYSVDFVTSELKDIVSLYTNAKQLKSEESIVNQVTSSLSDLNDELDRIALSEMAKIERKFAVKRSHFQDRKTSNEVKAIESLSEKEPTHV